MQRGSRKAAGRYQRHKPAPWFTRVRALLAGALVLGVGATLTLASWTDQEYAAGSFATSTFGIVGSTDGSSFGDHPATGPASLAFATTPGSMSPGTTVYSLFVVKTTAGTNVPGILSMSGAAVTSTDSNLNLGPYLKYGVRILNAGGACNATSFAAGTVFVADNSPLETPGNADPTLAVAGGSPISFCFAVTLPSGTANAAQGKNATATWAFTGTSNS